jgi:hypothetical protein
MPAPNRRSSTETKGLLFPEIYWISADLFDIGLTVPSWKKDGAAGAV